MEKIIEKASDVEKFNPDMNTGLEALSIDDVAEYPNKKIINDMKLSLGNVISNMKFNISGLADSYNNTASCSKLKWITDENAYLYNTRGLYETICFNYKTITNEMQKTINLLDGIFERIKTKRAESLKSEEKKRIVEDILANILRDSRITISQKNISPEMHGFKTESFRKRFSIVGSEILDSILLNKKLLTIINDSIFLDE